MYARINSHYKLAHYMKLSMKKYHISRLIGNGTNFVDGITQLRARCAIVSCRWTCTYMKAIASFVSFVAFWLFYDY